MNKTTSFKLSVMMFLEFFIWGCWFVTMGTFLSQAFNASGGEIGLAYETQSWGAIIAPFIIGLIADRYLGFRRSTLLGAWLLVAGHFGMAFEVNSGSPYLLELPGYLLGSHLVFELNLGIFGNHLKSILKQPGGCMGPAIAFA